MNQKFRLGATLWLAGMVGVVVLSLTAIPQLWSKVPQSVPLEVAVAASVVQSGVLLALAAWAGVVLSAPIGLRAPSIEAALSGTNPLPLLKRQLVPAGVTGVLVGGLLIFLTRIAPLELLALNQSNEIPLAVRLLYGGITEEILLRWGLMTTLVWLMWRLIQKRVGMPRTSFVIGAIVVTALLFGVGHLPFAAAIGASLKPSVVAYVIAGNTLPGILFGFLYWRYGLEAAIIAHALGHAVAVVAST